MSGKKTNTIRLAIVVSEFNYDITELMLRKALSHAKFLGVEVTYVVKVPGVFDAPYAVAKLAEKDDVDAIVVLGAVIKGETKHDEVVAHQAARKMLDIGVSKGKPVTLGVIGPGATRAQAQARIEEYARRAVEAAVKLVLRLKRLESTRYSNETVFIE